MEEKQVKKLSKHSNLTGESSMNNLEFKVETAFVIYS